MLELSFKIILMVSLIFLFSFIDLKIILLSQLLCCTSVFQQLQQERCEDDTAGSFALLRVVNIHTKVHRCWQLIRKMNEKLHPYLSPPSSPRVKVCLQVFVAGCMLTE